MWCVDHYDGDDDREDDFQGGYGDVDCVLVVMMVMVVVTVTVRHLTYFAAGQGIHGASLHQIWSQQQRLPDGSGFELCSEDLLEEAVGIK